MPASRAGAPAAARHGRCSSSRGRRRKGTQALRLRDVLAAALAAAALGGCALLALPALGTEAVSGGASSLGRAGTDWVLGGRVERTFAVPVDTLYQAVITTSRRLALDVRKDHADKDGRRLVAEGIHRTFSMRVVAISPQLSRLALTVKEHVVLRDRATASEFIAQLERTLVPSLVLGRSFAAAARSVMPPRLSASERRSKRRVLIQAHASKRTACSHRR